MQPKIKKITNGFEMQFNILSFETHTILYDVIISDEHIYPGACPGIRKGGGAKSESLFFCFSIFQGGALLRKEMRK